MEERIKRIRGSSWLVAWVATMAMTTIGLFYWSNVCRAENSVDGIVEVNLTYSHGNKQAGGNSSGFAQGKYTGTGVNEVDANANAFGNLSGRTNEGNDQPDIQQNAWSRAEINSSASKEVGDVKLETKGKASQANWAHLEKDKKNISDGGNNFTISYQTESPGDTPSVSGEGAVLGWTTVKQLDYGMAAETYGEGQVNTNGAGQSRVKGMGGIEAQSFKGQANGNYAGAKAGADFTIDQQNPSGIKYGHAQGQTMNFISSSPYGVYGKASAASSAETGKATNQ